MQIGIAAFDHNGRYWDRPPMAAHAPLLPSNRRKPVFRSMPVT
jgi:hypothetical protein